MAGGRLQCNVSLSEPTIDSVVIRARSSAHTIYMQKVVYSPSAVIVPGTVLAFLDSITGASIGLITVMPASVAQPPYVIDYGVGDSITSGVPLTKGANLIMSILAGGMTGRLHVKAYQLPLYVVTPRVFPATAGFTANV